MTVGRYAPRWIESRKALGLADWRNDEARLRRHVLPRLGGLELDCVRARHLVDLFNALRMSKKLAAKTLYNVYSVLKALFRDAQIADLIVTSPCILTKYQLGENVDKNPEWRPTAIYTRSELETLISDARIPPDRQVLYSLEGLAALRHGEAAGLRWRHWDNAQKPLGALLIATSYDKGRTKTNKVRRMPVHPVLAAMLAEWKLSGWQAMMGRPPAPDDLIVPMPKSARVSLGKMRSKNDSYKRLRADLVALGLRHRRSHDLRRTMISLAIEDGARKDLLERCTHNPGRPERAIDGYVTLSWLPLCAEVAKLRISRQPRGQVVSLPATGSGQNQQ
jgi:integrase